MYSYELELNHMLSLQSTKPLFFSFFWKSTPPRLRPSVPGPNRMPRWWMRTAGGQPGSATPRPGCSRPSPGWTSSVRRKRSPAAVPARPSWGSGCISRPQTASWRLLPVWAATAIHTAPQVLSSTRPLAPCWCRTCRLQSRWKCSPEQALCCSGLTCPAWLNTPRGCSWWSQNHLVFVPMSYYMYAASSNTIIQNILPYNSGLIYEWLLFLIPFTSSLNFAMSVSEALSRRWSEGRVDRL